MTEQRKGEIALVLLKRQAIQNGISLGPNVKREMGNVAKDLDIPIDELMQFSKEIAEELLRETFAPSRVKVTRVE